MFLTRQAYELLETRAREAESRAIAAEADLASFMGTSPLWISLEGFNRVSDREIAWKEAAIEAQGYLTPMTPTWLLIESLRTGSKSDDEPIPAHS